MQLGKIYTVQTDFTKPHIIEIEVDISNKGIPSCTIVGLADKAIDESKERIAAALKNSGLGNIKQKKIVVSLSPANLKKEGPLFDLPIAIGILLADSENDLVFDAGKKLFIGELSLDGSIKKITGALSAVYGAKQAGYAEVYIPESNIAETTLIDGITVFGASHITDLVQHLLQEQAEIPNPDLLLRPGAHTEPQKTTLRNNIDFAHVVEQKTVKRVLEIAAAGGHNVAMYGPPGTGKTMLAQAFCSILPDLSHEKLIESTMIHSSSGVSDKIIVSPPLRAPHHTSSYVSVIGGGANPKPGEITFAHNGVLFLDEFTEFDKRVLESLREPLEENKIRIARSKASVTFPADFILLAALNPPTEVYRSGSLITPADERRFRRKLSGPIMDRIDLWIEVPKIEHAKLLSQDTSEETSAQIKKRVIAARGLQHTRHGKDNLNGMMRSQQIRSLNLTADAKQILNEAGEKLQISPRVYHKMISLGQTIADLEDSQEITRIHILEALQYRPKDIL